MATAVKISDDIAGAARSESRLMHRSMTEQVEYWARIGRALERMPGVSMERIRAVLRGGENYDTLNGDERALALGALESLTFNPKGDRSLQREKSRAGMPYTALDEQGRVVEISANGHKRVLEDVDQYGERSDPAA